MNSSETQFDMTEWLRAELYQPTRIQVATLQQSNIATVDIDSTFSAMMVESFTSPEPVQVADDHLAIEPDDIEDLDIDFDASFLVLELEEYLKGMGVDKPIPVTQYIPTGISTSTQSAKQKVSRKGFFEQRPGLKKFAFYGSAVLIGAGILPQIVEPTVHKAWDATWEFVSTDDSVETAEGSDSVTVSTVSAPITTDSLAATTTTIEAALETTTPETTTASTVPEQKPYSYMDALENGSISLNQTSTHQYATIDIPKICLNGIQAYGSNKGDVTDVQLLDLLQANGQLTESERMSLAGGSSKAKADIYQKFDPIYWFNTDETPQQDCGIEIGTSKYPARWTRTPKGSTAAQYSAISGAKLDQIQPVVDIDWRGVAPGQPGNVVVSGHRTTESAPLANIDALTMGDSIVVTGDNGKVFTYTVVSTEMVNPDKNGLDTILNFTSELSDSTLTMYSCDDGGQTRYVVRATLVN